MRILLHAFIFFHQYYAHSFSKICFNWLQPWWLKSKMQDFTIFRIVISLLLRTYSSLLPINWYAQFCSLLPLLFLKQKCRFYNGPSVEIWEFFCHSNFMSNQFCWIIQLKPCNLTGLPFWGSQFTKIKFTSNLIS